MTPGASRAGLRRVLVVAYYFPPMGLSGVQRTVKFARYLPEYGWEPVVLSVEPGGYFAFDDELMAEVQAAGIEVHRTTSLDPNRLFGRRRAVSMPGESRRSLLARAAQTIFIPDSKIGWYPFALRAGRRLVARSPVHAVLSTAPPYTGHLIGARLAADHGLPLVLDYRDDWLDNPRHVYPTALHRRIHARLERRVLDQADAVVAINGTIARAIAGRSAGSADPVVIPQGYDPADYPASPPDSGGFTLTYTGVFYDAQRPDAFLQGLARFLERRPDARSATRARFLGLFPDSARAEVARLGLDDVVDIGPYVTHREAMEALAGTAVAWLVVGRRSGSEQISTGKLYAYIGARVPILALVPEGEARRELLDYGAARIVDPDDVAGTADAIALWYDAWRTKTLPAPDPEFVARFDRRRLAGNLAAVLDSVAPQGDG